MMKRKPGSAVNELLHKGELLLTFLVIKGTDNVTIMNRPN